MTEERKQKVNADVAAPAPTGLWKKAGIALLATGRIRHGILRRLPQARLTSTTRFARCLTDRQVKMYGAYWCPHCAEQKEMFGESFALRAVRRVRCGGRPAR